MLTSKQRARLRALANPLETIMQVGKSGVTPELTASVGDALTARELIKLRAWKPAPPLPGRPPSSWPRPPARRWSR